MPNVTIDHLDPVESIFGMKEDEFAELARSVLIFILHRKSEGINADMLRAAGAWGHWGAPFGPLEDSWGGIMDVTRCNMAKAFLDYCADKPNVKFLVMIDNDESVPWNAPYKLASWNLPVVSGVVCSWGREHGGIYANFTMKPKNGGKACFPSWSRTRKMPSKGLIQVFGLGGGLLCVRKDVFAEMFAAGINPFEIPPSIREESFKTGNLKMSEDMAFSNQLEAMGVKRYVDLSVRATHNKFIPIEWPSVDLDDSIDPQTWEVDPGEYHDG